MRKPFAIAALVFLALSAAVLWSAHSGSSTDIAPLTPKEATTYWKEQIERRGPAQAYTEMLRQGAPLSFVDQHLMAHAFGEALYLQKDLSLVRYCGRGEFQLGCFHQFMGMATAEYGLEILATLKKDCDTASADSFSCRHAVGHGALAYFGYEEEHLQPALAECTSIYTNTSDASYCMDGVFMEYNLREMAALTEARAARPFDAQNPYAPCMNLRGDARDACVYELPLWWSHVRNASLETKDFFTLCRSLPQAHDRHVCMIGIGYPVSEEAHFDGNAAAALCDVGATPDETLACKAGAARRLKVSGQDSIRVCALVGLEGDAERYCKDGLARTRDQSFLVPLPH